MKQKNSSKQRIPEVFPPSALEEAIHFLHADLGNKIAKIQEIQGASRCVPRGPWIKWQPRNKLIGVCVCVLVTNCYLSLSLGPNVGPWTNWLLSGVDMNWVLPISSYLVSTFCLKHIYIHLYYLPNAGNIFHNVQGAIHKKYVNTPPSHYPPEI